MRKLFYYSLLCAVWIGAVSCKSDDAPTPPKPSFTVDKVSGLSGATEFTFTVKQVDGDAISLLPYGADSLGLGGILISTFTDGQAVVKFTYGHVGTFNAVVVANNHSADGKTVKNTFSDGTAITITSDEATISEFILKVYPSLTGDFAPVNVTGTVDQVAATIDLTVPFGNIITADSANYTASAWSTVTVNNVVQVNGGTSNNFTNPLSYKVTAANGTSSKTYVVTVSVTPAETVTTVKSLSGVSKKNALGSAVDNTLHQVVLYDVIGNNDNDSVNVKYELDGKFASLKDGADVIKQDALLDLSAKTTVTVHAEDGTTQDYDIYTGQVPNLAVAFNGLTPIVADSSARFTVPMDVLTGTDTENLATTVSLSYAVPAGVTVGSMQITDANGTRPFTSGDVVDYTDGGGNIAITQDVKLWVNIHDNALGGFDYVAVYIISVTVVK